MAFAAKVRTSNSNKSIGSTLFGTCTTAANQYAKTVVIDGVDALIPGMTVHVKFVFSNTIKDNDHPVTLEIFPSEYGTGLGAAPIYLYGTEHPGTTEKTSWKPNSVLSLTYEQVGGDDAWLVNGWLNDDTTYDVVSYYPAPAGTNGLMSVSDKRILDNLAAVNIDVRTGSTAVTIDDGDWAADTSGTGGVPKYEDYPYRAAVYDDLFVNGMVPQATFDPADIAEYGIAPIAEVVDDYIYFYAEVLPDADITVPMTLLFKGNSWPR